MTLGCGAPLEPGAFSFDLEVPDAAHVHPLSDTRAMRFAEHTEATIVVRRSGVYDEGARLFARAVSSDPEVFTIVRDDGRARVDIRTALQGNATLDIRGPDGAIDGLQIQVRPAAHVSVEPDWSNAVRDGVLTAALVGDAARLRVRARDAEGEELIAAGLPIRGEPTTRVEVSRKPVPEAVDVRFTARGRVTLVGEGGAPLLVEVIDASDVDELTLEHVEPTRPGDLLLLRPLVTLREDTESTEARSMLARKHQLLSPQIEIVERSPGVCRARITNERYGDETGVGLVEVTNHHSGRCMFDVRVGEASTTYDAATVVFPAPG